MKVFLLSLFIIAGSTLFVQSPAAASIDEERKHELLHLLKQDCGSCHGLTLKGGLGPALLPLNLQHMPISFLTETILNGRPGTAMPPWRSLVKPHEAMWLAEILKQGVNP